MSSNGNDSTFSKYEGSPLGTHGARSKVPGSLSDTSVSSFSSNLRAVEKTFPPVEPRLLSSKELKLMMLNLQNSCRQREKSKKVSKQNNKKKRNRRFEKVRREEKRSKVKSRRKLKIDNRKKKRE
jgi:hypothetical protein